MNTQEMLGAYDKVHTVLKDLDYMEFKHYLETVCNHSDALLTKYAPFKIGDRVELKEGICRDGGWPGIEYLFNAGARGTVRDVTYTKDRFRFGIVLDIDYWIDSFSGGKHQYSEKEKGVYGLYEEFLQPETSKETARPDCKPKLAWIPQPPPRLEFIPWTNADLPTTHLCVKKKSWKGTSGHDNCFSVVTGAQSGSVYLGGEWVTLQELGEKWVRADGRPCGKWVEVGY